MRRRCHCWFASSLLGLAGAAQAASAEFAAPPVDPAESVLAEDVPQAAPDPNPPPYTLLRFNERYDYLADPRNRGDLFDPLKYIPLGGSDGQSYLSLGGELRERYENLHHAGFGTNPAADNESYLLQRVTFHADLHLDSHLRVFAQGLSGLQFGEQKKAPPVQQNPIDLQQAFADLVIGDPGVAGPRLTMRLGRFEMSYGSGRLIATRAAPNLPFKFDGAEFIAASGDARLYAFLVRPGQEYRYHLDGENDAQTFWGIYAVLPAGVALPAALDLYYLGYRNEQARFFTASGTELRHSIGLRISGKLDGWSYDWEPVVQWGKFSDREIFAWTIATDTAYTFATTDWRPRLGLKADIASGDSRGPNGRYGGFDPLFFKSGYFNDASLIRPTNIADLHPSLQLVPSKALTLTAANDLLWRATTHDGVYGPPGNGELRPLPGSRYIGTTAELAAEWKISRHLVATASYVHLFAGNYVAAARGRSVDYLGTWFSLVW